MEIFYNLDGNQLECVWDNESYYGKEVKGGCLLIGQESGKVVGCTINSIQSVFEEVGYKLLPFNPLKDKFKSLYQQWVEYCQGDKIRTRDYLDCEAYLEIITMGKSILPFILEEFQSERKNVPGCCWAYLIYAIVGHEFQIEPSNTPEQNVIKWLKDYINR